MKRVGTSLLVLLALASVVLAVLLPTVIVPGQTKTPTDVNTTVVSTGSAKLLDPLTGKPGTATLRATRHVRSDAKASDDTDTTVDETLCVVIVKGSTPGCVDETDPRFLIRSTDRVTSDRKSAEAVHVAKYKEAVDGDTSVRHRGLSYKWPIDAKKRTYQFFQPDLKAAFPAEYQGSAKRGGLTVYVFRCATGSHPYKIQGAAAGTYSDVRTVYVEPRTGLIVDGTEHQVQTLANGQTALDTTLTFTKASVDAQVRYAKDKLHQLRVAAVYVPIGLGVFALLCLVGAASLSRSRRRTAR